MVVDLTATGSSPLNLRAAQSGRLHVPVLAAFTIHIIPHLLATGAAVFCFDLLCQQRESVGN